MSDAAEAAASAQPPIDSPVIACPNRFALEALVLGEDGQPVAGVALELRKGSDCLRTRTSAQGLARFEGLDAAEYQLCPTELDAEAWTLTGQEALEQAGSQVKADWSAVDQAAAPEGVEHRVAAEDSVDRLALANGLFPETLWQHPRNDTLRSTRHSRNVLAPDDLLFIPAIRQQTIAVQTKLRYVIKRRGVPSRLRLRLLDSFKPLANIDWTLRVPGEATQQGQTDAEGVVQAWIGASASSAVLSYLSNGALRELDISLGALLPGGTAGGWRQRLLNLGFACDAEDQQPLSAADQQAIRRFQQSWGLPVTGDADEATVEKIRIVHDGRQLPASAQDKPVQGSS